MRYSGFPVFVSRQMLPSVRKALLLVVVFGMVGTVIAALLDPEPAQGASSKSESSNETTVATMDDDLKPVDNMHHFMEYIYEPVHDRLKEAVKKEPADKKGWSALKSDSLILAESSILLADRAPAKEDPATWVKSSKTTYAGASALYQAARKKDFEGVKKGYAAMLDGCKQCHEAYRK